MSWKLRGTFDSGFPPLGNMTQGIGYPLREVSETEGGGALPRGVIQVSTPSGVSIYEAVADGVADDRATISQALSEAAANMPASVVFGPGDYGLYQGVEVKPPQGARGLVIRGMGENVTRLRFNGPDVLQALGYIALKIEPSVVPAVGDYANYLYDIGVYSMGFYDDDPAGHQNPAGPEESHGVSFNFVINGVVQLCRLQDIGDEGVNFSNVISGSMVGNFSNNTPSIGFSGGAFSVGGGCQGILISHNQVSGTNTPGVRSTLTGQVGIDVSVVTDPNMSDISSVNIQNNVVRDFTEAGIQLNCADTANNSNILNVNIGNNIVANSSYGIFRRGSQGQGVNTSIVANTVLTIDNSAIGFDVPAANNFDCNLSFNTIMNVGGGSGTPAGVLCNGTRLVLSGNTMENVAGYGVYVFDGDDVTIDGGILDGVGGTGFQNIRQQNPSRNTVVTGVNIVKAASDQQVIRGCSEVRDCQIQQTAPFWAQISSTKRAIGNSINGGIRVEGNGCIVANNSIITAENLNGDGIELADQQDCIVTGNYVEVSYPNRVGIDANANCDYTIFTNNNTRNSAVSGRAYLTTNPNIIESNNQPAFTDRG